MSARIKAGIGLFWFASLISASGCFDAPVDVGIPDGSLTNEDGGSQSVDAGTRDSGANQIPGDAGADAGMVLPDAGPDAGRNDGGIEDSGIPSSMDAGIADGGSVDAGIVLDSGLADAGEPPLCDAGSPPIVRTVFTSPIALFGGAGAMLATDAQDNVYVAENYSSTGGPRVTRVTPTGASSIVVPNGVLGHVTGLACNASGDLFIADGTGNGASGLNGTNQIFKLSRGGTSAVVFAAIANPIGLATDSSGAVYAASFADRAVYKFSTSGTPIGRVGPVLPDRPYGIAVDSSGSIFVAGYGLGSTSGGGSTIYKISSAGVLTTYASPPIVDAYGLAIDATGVLWASYYNSLKLVRITAQASYTIIPGGWTADDAPNGVAFDSTGALYIAVNGGRTTASPAVVRIGGATPPLCSVRR